jgi:predicted ATPase/DNA-binding SARP family transcriptional activator
VARTVASQLGVPDAPGQDAAEAITGHVSGRPVLIVLDNGEHLAAAVADLAETLLAGCPALTILATSREPLGVEGECSWPVPPLSWPDAVRLFEQRAQLVRPSFRVSEGNADTVRQICRRLDGLPLAIELAAARMRILSATQLAERLDDLFAVLTGGARSAPRRHQALRATLDWSYELLTADERAVFRRLAIFSGGFTLAAAEQVAAGDGIAARDILDLLTRLADKSLLRVDQGSHGAHYQLLTTIRDYAKERQTEAGEAEPLRRAHLRYFTALAEEIGPLVDGGSPEQGPNGRHGLEELLDQLDLSRPDIRVALDFAQESGDTVAALRIAGQLGRYAYLRGHYHEVRDWMDQAVVAGEGGPAELRAKALLGSGRLALLQCDYGPAVRRLEAALRLYRERADPAGIASALQVLGSVAREQGRYARSMELHAESLSIAERAGDRRAVASARGYLGFVAWLQCDFGRAIAECTAALDQFRELGDVEGTAWSLLSLGTVARYQGDASRAAALLGDSRSLAESIGFQEGVAWSLEQLGLLAASQDDHAAATALLDHSLEIHRALQDRWRTSSVLEDLAAVALTARGTATGTAHAAALLGAAQAIRAAIGTVIPPCERAQHEESVSGAQAMLGAEAFAAAWQRGRLAQPEDPAQPDDPAQPEPTITARADGSPATAPAGAEVPADPGRGELTLVIQALGAATVRLGDGATLTSADWGYAKPRELLFLLATSPPLSREQIGAALWPDASRQQLGNALHTALRELRHALGDPGWIVYANGRYTVNPARPRDCDVDTFMAALTAARQARPAAAALPGLQRAVTVYGGDFLADMAAGDWAQARRDELSRAFESALLAIGRLQVAAGRYQAAAAAYRRVIGHEPLNESAHRELMSCWERLGETARAIRHYEELAGTLQDQLGAAPSAETTALYERLRAR